METSNLDKGAFRQKDRRKCNVAKLQDPRDIAIDFKFGPEYSTPSSWVKSMVEIPGYGIAQPVLVAKLNTNPAVPPWMMFGDLDMESNFQRDSIRLLQQFITSHTDTEGLRSEYGPNNDKRLGSRINQGLAHSRFQDDYIERPRSAQLPQKTTRSRSWNAPIGAVPEQLLFIWPERYRNLDLLPHVLPSRIDYDVCNPRYLALLGMRHSLKNITANVIDAPAKQIQIRQQARRPTRKIRTPQDSLQNQFSKRIQDWRSANGVFCERASCDDRGKGVGIYDKMAELSVAQIFHGVIGSIDRQSFTMSPPLDRYHRDFVSNQPSRYAVPPPVDVPEKARIALAARGVVLPTFREFLRRNADTWHHFWPEHFERGDYEDRSQT